MPNTSLTVDIDGALKRLTRVQKKQVPFATSVALNNTAKYVVEKEKQEAKKKLDEPTPFTLRGFRVRRSNKRNLEAAVYIAPIQAKYLLPHIKGGRQIKKSQVTPKNLRLNKYGNIPGLRTGKIKKLLQKPNVFAAEIRGVKGIWQRDKKGGLKLLVASAERITYKKQFAFYGVAARHASNRFAPEFYKALRRALASAR